MAVCNSTHYFLRFGVAAKYAWIFQILIFTHFSINWVPINTYKWYWVYNGPNWENIGPQSHLFKKSPILLWKTGPYISTFASRHGRTKRRTDLKFWIFPFDYKDNIWAKWEENPRGSCGNFSENLVISYGMTPISLGNSLGCFQSHYIKGVLHLLPKISMFCALSQNI